MLINSINTHIMFTDVSTVDHLRHLLHSVSDLLPGSVGESNVEKRCSVVSCGFFNLFNNLSKILWKITEVSKNSDFNTSLNDVSR